MELRRVDCSKCSKRMEAVSWFDRDAQVKKRLADAVVKTCRNYPHTTQMFGLHYSSVRLLERCSLEARLEALPTPQPRRLVTDEFALFKGHRYASVVLDADTRQVLWIDEGRNPAAVRPFFEGLGVDGCTRIKAVAMDMHTA